MESKGGGIVIKGLLLVLACVITGYLVLIQQNLSRANTLQEKANVMREKARKHDGQQDLTINTVQQQQNVMQLQISAIKSTNAKQTALLQALTIQVTHLGDKLDHGQ